MFKTGALNRKMNEIFDGRVLTFYGVRRSESATRANYNRVEEKTESVKISKKLLSLLRAMCISICLFCLSLSTY